MALAQCAPRTWARGGLRVPGKAARRQDRFKRPGRTPPDSRIRHPGAANPRKLVSAGPQEHGTVQHPVADAAKARVVPSRPAHTVRSAAAEKDKAADRTPVASLRSAAGTRTTGKRRSDR